MYENVFEDDEENVISISLMLKIPREEIPSMIGRYPVVVEMWHNCVGNDSSFSKRRKFRAEFDEKERKKAREMYNLFYRWYLKTGTPNYWVVSSKTVTFCRRLIRFFGEV